MLLQRMNLSKLVEDAKERDAGAQENLFNWLADAMMVVCRRYVKNSEEAEEVMLDGWYKFFTSLSSFTYQNEAALRSWIKRIMINECLMLLRKKKAFILLSESEAEEIELEEEALNQLSAKEILDLILRLPAGYRTVFNLHEIEGMEHKEIAAMLGIAEGTSKSQLKKARALLQRNISQRGNDYATRK